jgi:hypothetical protein
VCSAFVVRAGHQDLQQGFFEGRLRAAESSLIARLAALSGATRLEQLGITSDELRAVAAAAQRRPELRRMSPPPTASEVLALLGAALH